MDAYRRRTGERLTYARLARASGVSISTLQSMAARPKYNTRLSTIEKLCVTLNCEPGDLLELAKEAHGPVV
jgi:DNA-binding Xre family transcriptional regulator